MLILLWCPPGNRRNPPSNSRKSSYSTWLLLSQYSYWLFFPVCSVQQEVHFICLPFLLWWQPSNIEEPYAKDFHYFFCTNLWRMTIYEAMTYSRFVSGIKRSWIFGDLLWYIVFQFQYRWRIGFMPWNIDLNSNLSLFVLVIVFYILSFDTIRRSGVGRLLVCLEY